MVKVDASLKGFGAVLSQKQDGRNVVIVYASHIETNREKHDWLQLHEARDARFEMGCNREVQGPSTWE